MKALDACHRIQERQAFREMHAHASGVERRGPTCRARRQQLDAQARAHVESPEQREQQIVVRAEWSWIAHGSSICSTRRFRSRWNRVSTVVTAATNANGGRSRVAW